MSLIALFSLFQPDTLIFLLVKFIKTRQKMLSKDSPKFWRKGHCLCL